MKSFKRILAMFMAITMILGVPMKGVGLDTKSSAAPKRQVKITSPYETVDWGKYGQYKANFHSHTTESDGGNEPFEMIEEHYKQGYDIVAITDHNVVSKTIDRTDTAKEYVSPERKAEMESGVGRDGRHIYFPEDSIEQSRDDHVNTFWADYNNPKVGYSMDNSISEVEKLGGISHINHPGRYTGGRTTKNNGLDGEKASNDPKNIQKYLDLFNKYDSLVGMEIINKKDGDSFSDRILWDNLLKETMPKRPIWGFSNDDNHSIKATGYSFNMMLLPENNPENVRNSMEKGTFYAVAKVAKRELGMDFVAQGKTPEIKDIKVDHKNGIISIKAENFNKIEWIADGKVIGKGNSINITEHFNEVNNYIRANISGEGGIAFTQPFGLEKLDSIINPYSDVNWAKMKQYKANFHSHTTESDGGNEPVEMIEEHYKQGYDVVAMSDHNFVSTTIDRTDTTKQYVTPERRAEMEKGVDREGRGILFTKNSIEQSRHDHVNTFWADYNNPKEGYSMEESIKKAQELGGISHINHPGRYTGGVYNLDDGSYGEMVSGTPETISKYMNLFNKYSSLVGMEIINKKDGDSFSDRILWDNLLSVSMPERPIWGFSNDDNHSIAATGFSYNMLIMPENNTKEVRHAMEDGNFYAVAKVSKRELGRDFKAEGNTPSITNVAVDQDKLTITIDTKDADKVVWIADGVEIAEGNTLNINDHEGKIFNYVRANVIGKGGIAFTQPFGIRIGSEKPVEFAGMYITAPKYELNAAANEKVLLEVSGKNTKFEKVDINLSEVKFTVEDENLLSVNEKGEVSIVNKPEETKTTTIYATLEKNGKVIKSNVIEMQVTVPYELPEGSVVYPISAGNDDVEENLDTGSMYMDSSDLEIAYDGETRQEIGLRFNNIEVPEGKELKEAFVQFAVDENKDSKNVDPFNVKISGELTDNSKEFTTEDKNVSSRTHTKSEVEWKDIPKWDKVGEAGKNQRTPDISSIIKEILEQKEFKSGNSLAIFLSGEGVRCADAFEDKNSKPASLVLVFGDKEEPEIDEKLEFERIKGENRYETAIEISKETYEKADTVIVASGQNYADALTASVLAGVKEGPLLLLDDDRLDIVKAELQRLDAKNVIIVGGDSYISESLEKSIEGYKVERYAGSDRYETAKKVYELVISNGGNKGQVIVADGRKYPDALTAGSYAVKTKTPIILSQGDIIPAKIELPKEAIIVGGIDSVGKDVESLFETVIRIKGENRYETSVKMAEEFFEDSDTAILASGELFADALTASVSAGHNDYPIILTEKDKVRKSVKEYIVKSKLENIIVVGGRSTITDTVLD
ncbi:MAG: cell wall-binding repeat-containing protein [Lagierella massiliensis]|nr:cell wall-binding repeat-containing protein [Lagierella massiliensis]